MCGIIGIINHNTKDVVDHDIFKTLVDSLAHRGPDDWGTHHDSNFSFGHRRLSIIDLSRRARQPMVDWNGKVYITYNGEIYNYREIKDELRRRGRKFLNDSDTEVILEAYKEWGIGCIDKFIGMFAFGLYDREREEFYLVRDRLGIKPVYYANVNNKFLFCSEPKGIIHYPGFKKELNLRAVSCFLSFRYCIGRETYFKGVFQLEPGHYVKVKNGRQQVVKYWDIDLNKRKMWLSQAYKRRLKLLIADAVKKRTISDVPLGSFLSGGIDSTIILKEMSNIVGGPVKAFTVTFDEAGFDESYYSDLAAKTYKAEAIKININGEAYFEKVKELIRYKDQPLGYHNEVASYLMAKELKKYVTVVLSGEGADEIFSGYGRLYRSPFDYKRLEIIERLPKKLQNILIRITGLNEKYLGKRKIDHFLMQYSYFPIEEKNEIYNENMKKAARNDEHIKKIFEEKFEESKHRSYYDQISYVFEKLHLPGIMQMLDATSMATAVEIRAPFVDHRLVQEAFNIPTRYKLRWKSLADFFKSLCKPAEVLSENHDITKFILRELYRDEIPREILERKKMVFPVPLTLWFKGDFSAFIRKELLSENSKIGMVFDQNKLQRWIGKKEKGDDQRYGRKMWVILNLEYWLREYF